MERLLHLWPTCIAYSIDLAYCHTLSELISYRKQFTVTHISTAEYLQNTMGS